MATKINHNEQLNYTIKEEYHFVKSGGGKYEFFHVPLSNGESIELDIRNISNNDCEMLKSDGYFFLFEKSKGTPIRIGRDKKIIK